jgi:DNA-binding transcriptional LysR family regulator
MTGDPQGFVDTVLAPQGHSRRVALTVPNFMFALAVVADSDLVCAVPRRFAELHAARFGLRVIEPPLPLGQFTMNLVVPEVAMMDSGVAWLVGVLRSTSSRPSRQTPRPGRAARSDNRSMQHSG